MIEYITNCPCCNRQLKIVIDEASGNLISTSFLNEENQEYLQHLLSLNGIEFGQKGSD